MLLLWHLEGRTPSCSRNRRCLCDTLRMTARAVSVVYDDALRPLGLRVTQFSLLSRAASMGPVESAAVRGVGARQDDFTAQSSAARTAGPDRGRTGEDWL